MIELLIFVIKRARLCLLYVYYVKNYADSDAGFKNAVRFVISEILAFLYRIFAMFTSEIRMNIGCLA